MEEGVGSGGDEAAKTAVEVAVQDQLLSMATRHEHEAELLLQKAIEEEQIAAALKRDGAEPKLNLSPLNPSDNDKLPPARQSFRKSTRASLSLATSAEKASLMDAATYLSVLQQHQPESATGADEVQRTPSSDGSVKKLHNIAEVENEDIAELNAADRVHKAATVLRAAGAFKRGLARAKKTASEPKTGKEASGPTAGVADLEQPENEHHDDGDEEFEEVGDDEVEHPSGAALAMSWRSRRRLRRKKRHERLVAFPSRARQAIGHTLMTGQEEWRSFAEFFNPKRKTFCQEMSFVLAALVVPSMLVALLLFYILDNPPTGRCKPDDGELCGANSQGEPVASASYWVLFLGVRQGITWLLAKATDMLLIDWLLMQHMLVARLLGARVSLVLVQSRGWPSVTFWWAMYDFMLLYGKDNFSHHWLFWQDFAKIFTKENPSGDIPDASWYEDILITMMVIAGAVSLKRHFLGLHLGQRLYSRFNERLEETMMEVTLISELAVWVRRKYDKKQTYAVWLSDYADKQQKNGDTVTTPQRKKHSGRIRQALAKRLSTQSNPATPDRESSRLAATSGLATPPKAPYTAPNQESVHSSNTGESIDYDLFLEMWEEPRRGNGEHVSGSKIIEFRKAFTVMTRPFFFSTPFGSVETREDCIEASDHLFRMLLKIFEQDESVSVNDMTRWMYKGCNSAEEKERAACLILLLRPDSENRLHIIDFVKGIDEIYRKVRLLENAVNNASDIDKSYESFINIIFFFALGCVALVILGLDPITFFLSWSSLIVGFSFVIGPGSAQYFEGVMMVLGRQPYDVGDRIAISFPEDLPDPDGSAHWMVESIDLVTTTARLTATGEIASFSNGSLARCRIINMNRSPTATVYVRVKFGTDVPYATIMIFRSAIQKFVDDRPQEWVSMSGFRTSRVEQQLNFVEYSVVLQHRLSWQSIVPILDSKAAVAGFAVEVQKQLGCRYQAPSMPVEIQLNSEVAGLPLTAAESSKGTDVV